MPERVITVDVEAMLDGDAVLIDATVRPYNPDGLPGRWRGGYYVDAIIEAEGFADFASLLSTGEAYEYTGGMPARLLDAGAGHTFLGWQRPTVVPPTPQLGRRRAVVTIDLGANINAKVTRLDVLPVTASSRAFEVLADGPNPNASVWGPEVFDALDDHPGRLRTALERRGTNRRQTSTDPPVGWGNRRGP